MRTRWALGVTLLGVPDISPVGSRGLGPHTCHQDLVPLIDKKSAPGQVHSVGVPCRARALTRAALVVTSCRPWSQSLAGVTEKWPLPQTAAAWLRGPGALPELCL